MKKIEKIGKRGHKPKEIKKIEMIEKIDKRGRKHKEMIKFKEL